MRSLKNRNVLSYAMFPSIGSCQDSANEKSESDSKKKKINKNRKYSVSWMKNRKIAKLLSFKRRFLSRIRRKNSIVDDRPGGNQNRGGIYSILLTRILKGCACHSRLLWFGGKAFVIRPIAFILYINENQRRSVLPILHTSRATLHVLNRGWRCVRSNLVYTYTTHTKKKLFKMIDDLMKFH